MRDDVQEEIRQAAEDLEFAPVEVEEEDAPVIADLMKKFGYTVDQIKARAEQYMPLAIQGMEDKTGYAAVHSARIEMRDIRLEVDRRRKRAKSDALKYTRMVDRVGNMLFDLIAPVETHLLAEEKRVDAEIEAAKLAKQREKDAMIQRRIDALAAVGHPVNLSEIAQMNDTVFQMVLKTATEAFEERERLRIAAEAALAEKRAEEERKAKEEAEAKAKAEAAERARLAEERKRLEAMRAEQEREAFEIRRQMEAEAAEIRKAREAIEAERRAQEQAAREEQIRREVEAKAKADAERKAQEEAARKEREAKEAAERQERAEAERRAKEAARPDAEKILALVESLRGTAWPKMTTAAGQAVITEAQDAMTRYCDVIMRKANAITTPVFG